jgi:carbonic anhydrase
MPFTSKKAVVMITGIEALRRLREGNERFASEAQTGEMFLKRMRSAKTDIKQEPIAIILGCSDARVPIEMVFDQELGDLFVIRVAGNGIGVGGLGSFRYAAAHFPGSLRLVVVLGHSHCGAVVGTLDVLGRPRDPMSSHTRFIADLIEPAVAPLLAPALGYDRETLIREAVRANVRQSVRQLRHGSGILTRLIENDGLLVVGAEYSLETGRVRFVEGALEGEA